MQDRAQTTVSRSFRAKRFLRRPLPVQEINKDHSSILELPEPEAPLPEPKPRGHSQVLADLSIKSPDDLERPQQTPAIRTHRNAAEMLSMPFGGATLESPIVHSTDLNVSKAPSVTPSQALRNRRLKKDSNMSSILPNPSREPAASLPPAGAGTAVVAIPAAEKAGALQRKRDDSESNPMHVIPWDQRAVIPTTGFGMGACSCCTAPRFWERVDWCLRCTCLSIIPGAIIAYYSGTRSWFFYVYLMMEMPLRATSRTLGGGCKNILWTIQGVLVGVVVAFGVVAIHPESDYAWVGLYFAAELLTALLTDKTRRMACYTLSILMLIFYQTRSKMTYGNNAKFLLEAALGLALGAVSLVLPWPNLAFSEAKTYCAALSNTISIAFQGIICSFWAQTTLERELHLVKIMQLRQFMAAVMKSIDERLELAEYEPCSGVDMAQMEARKNLLYALCAKLSTMVNVVEEFVNNPSIVESPTMREMNSLISVPLGMLGSAIDTILLKICDFDHIVQSNDVLLFDASYKRFVEALAEARETVEMNSHYEATENDIFLGFFLHSVNDVCRCVASFKLPAVGPQPLQVVFPGWLRCWTFNLAFCRLLATCEVSSLARSRKR